MPELKISVGQDDPRDISPSDQGKRQPCARNVEEEGVFYWASVRQWQRTQTLVSFWGGMGRTPDFFHHKCTTLTTPTTSPSPKSVSRSGEMSALQRLLVFPHLPVSGLFCLELWLAAKEREEKGCGFPTGRVVNLVGSVDCVSSSLSPLPHTAEAWKV